MTPKILSPRVILPVAVVFGVLAIGIRAADVWDTVASGKLVLHAAHANDAVAADKPHKEEKAHAAEAPPPKDEASAGTRPMAGSPPPADMDSSPAELELLRQLSDRREQLEKRSRDLDTRESLLKVSEQRIDQKVKEMDTLRQQLQSMVNQISGAQQAQVDNLVKIYETMKPEEAAKIFETLDMHVLLSVIQKMKPARTAPIMAKMAPEKAKEITVALTKQDQLPQVK